MATAAEDDDEDLKLVGASASLLADLEQAIPRLLFRPLKSAIGGNGRVHSQANRRDVQCVTSLIEPFQGDPQLLDAKLKQILPPIVEALLEYLALGPRKPSNNNINLETAICTILYTLCKVRGNKVIVGFFSNEPRHLELILQATERTLDSKRDEPIEWQVPYVLLLWLSHLLLTPFDLATISTDSSGPVHVAGLAGAETFPLLTKRALRVALHYLPIATKAQDAAAAMLVRLAIRPDMQKLRLAHSLVEMALSIVSKPEDGQTTIYQRLGSLRFLAGIAASADLAHLVPKIYQACESISGDETAVTTNTNAVSKKVMVKIFRNIAIVSLRSASNSGPLLGFVEMILEDVIDYLLRSLGDRDTPVRYAAAKATSLIILELGAEMGHEVIQAVLDAFKEDIPRHGGALDFKTADPLKWHGLTLALSHTLFKRTASPKQLPNIVDALFAALQFQQRTATGSFVGANVRDAANFGIWSLARRYTSDELLAVENSSLSTFSTSTKKVSVIQSLGIQLILSACLDPEGNIRRGSSAALQELVGRHPNQVYEGISLVQIVDYQAVGLRKRAIIDVANRTAALCPMYWHSLVEALFGWRGLDSADVVSREAVSTSIAQLTNGCPAEDSLEVIKRVLKLFEGCSSSDPEKLHGLTMTAACIIEEALKESGAISGNNSLQIQVHSCLGQFWTILKVLQDPVRESNARTIRSELTSATVRFICALARFQNEATKDKDEVETPSELIDSVIESLLVRHEETVLSNTAPLAQALFSLERKSGAKLMCIDATNLCRKVSSDAHKSTLHGAGRAIALASLAMKYDDGTSDRIAFDIMRTLAGLISSVNVDWRVIALRALQITTETITGGQYDKEIIHHICADASRGMADYTIDERGDIGSLVRLQAIACTTAIFEKEHANLKLDAMSFRSDTLLSSQDKLTLQSDIIRLSFDKLDRVRMQAAQCRRRFLDPDNNNSLTEVSSPAYFTHALRPLLDESTNPAIHSAILEGTISSAGTSAETLLQASRTALFTTVKTINPDPLAHLLTEYTQILKTTILKTNNTQPALALLAFLLDMHIPQRLAETSSTFKWRNLLSTVQKSHHKSNDIPKILAAVHVYLGLAEIEVIREEVLKKLVGMLKTNPYPSIRASVAEALLLITKEPMLKNLDWTKPALKQRDLVDTLQAKYVTV
ncbi:Hypothetical protein R9X50_00754200 [Acrodontium crateriforme]|uniref:Tubulin-specific chaperone D C-terminal domain-containing protein n=1 Tax=Acrodontium crateriforme TaxID=150365 RepID=A0AAQ3RAU2_9PEZI|nr:Hypothetical protein R9X50_00754200 [Acrodontium crateriforme]